MADTWGYSCWHLVAYHCNCLCDPRTMWYFYNSAGFKVVADLALLGALAYVVPVLLSIPQPVRLVVGHRNTERAEFNAARTQSRRLGCFVVLASFFPPLFYIPLLRQTWGKKDNIAGKSAIQPSYLVWLYLTTVIVAVLFIWFYRTWRRTQALHSSFEEEAE